MCYIPVCLWYVNWILLYPTIIVVSNELIRTKTERNMKRLLWQIQSARPLSNNFQVPSLSWKREEERTDQRLFGVISLINLKIYKENMSPSINNQVFFFGDSRTIKRRKSEQKSVFSWMEDRSKIIWFLCRSISR